MRYENVKYWKNILVFKFNTTYLFTCTHKILWVCILVVSFSCYNNLQNLTKGPILIWKPLVQNFSNIYRIGLNLNIFIYRKRKVLFNMQISTKEWQIVYLIKIGLENIYIAVCTCLTYMSLSHVSIRLVSRDLETDS